MPPFISIVDDDVSAREGIGDLVASLGYSVLTFVSAEQFLESGLADETVCVITDLQLPVLSGLDLQDQLTARGYSTPVIVMTAFPDEKRRARALGAGAFGFLVKPFDEQSLVQCLADAIGTSLDCSKS